MRLNKLMYSALLLGALIDPSVASIIESAPCIDATDRTCVTGIKDLEVTGVGSLDVSFFQGSYISVYGDEIPFFVGRAANAENALIAIAEAFNDTTPRAGIISQIPPSGAEQFLLAPIAVGQNLTDFDAAFISGNASADTYGTNVLIDPFLPTAQYGPDGSPDNVGAFARFSPAEGAVPMPSTLVLLALGIAGVGVVRRRDRLGRT